MSDESSCRLKNLPECLLELAGFGLFRLNAFRVLGLQAHATDSEIRKQGDKLKFMGQHGGSVHQLTVGPLPLDPPPLGEAVSDALQRLRDPEQRFIEEFFWFWPQPGLGSKDAAIVALSNREIEAAIEIWIARARGSDDHGRSSHNLAVMFHALALDIEYARQTETISDRMEAIQHSYWQKGFSQWQALVADEDFWIRLESRVLDLNDPRLTTASVEQIRMGLPLVLLLINAQIVARASASGADGEARKYWSLRCEAGFSEAVVEEASARSARRIRDLISAICKTAERESEGNPEAAAECVRRMLQQTQPLLAGINLLLGSDGVEGDEVRDEVATAATNCLCLLSDDAAKSELARELLERTRPYAVSLSVRERMDYLRATFLRSAYRP
jgi:hypothetical protein